MDVIQNAAEAPQEVNPLQPLVEDFQRQVTKHLKEMFVVSYSILSLLIFFNRNLIRFGQKINPQSIVIDLIIIILNKLLFYKYNLFFLILIFYQFY